MSGGREGRKKIQIWGPGDRRPGKKKKKKKLKVLPRPSGDPVVYPPPQGFVGRGKGGGNCPGGGGMIVFFSRPLKKRPASEFSDNFLRAKNFRPGNKKLPIKKTSKHFRLLHGIVWRLEETIWVGNWGDTPCPGFVTGPKKKTLGPHQRGGKAGVGVLPGGTVFGFPVRFLGGWSIEPLNFCFCPGWVGCRGPRGLRVFRISFTLFCFSAARFFPRELPGGFAGQGFKSGIFGPHQSSEFRELGGAARGLDFGKAFGRSNGHTADKKKTFFPPGPFGARGPRLRLGIL